jgi:hypothetical protein
VIDPLILDGLLELHDRGDRGVQVVAHPWARPLDRQEVHQVYSWIAGWQASQPAPERVEGLGASSGGDPRLMRGGRDHRATGPRLEDYRDPGGEK